MTKKLLISFQFVEKYLKLVLGSDDKMCPIIINIDNISSFVPSNDLSSLYIKYYDSTRIMYLEIVNDFEICDSLVDNYLKWKIKSFNQTDDQNTTENKVFFNKNIKKEYAVKGKDLFQEENVILSFNNLKPEIKINESNITLPPKKSINNKIVKNHKMITRSMVDNN
jgi:hypothetical protein